MGIPVCWPVPSLSRARAPLCSMPGKLMPLIKAHREGMRNFLRMNLINMSIVYSNYTELGEPRHMQCRQRGDYGISSDSPDRRRMQRRMSRHRKGCFTMDARKNSAADSVLESLFRMAATYPINIPWWPQIIIFPVLIETCTRKSNVPEPQNCFVT